MNTSLLLRAIPAISEGAMTLGEFAKASGLGRKVAMDVMRYLTKNEIGHMDHQNVTFDISDKINASLLALRMGADAEDVSLLLHWKDFELLATNVLDAAGYTTFHGFRLKKPRIEIDVVAIKEGTTLLVDCKHWKRSSPSVLEKFAEMQVNRAKAFLRAKSEVRTAVPLILTLHSESTTLANGVPVVPITKFRSFLNELSGYLDDIRIVRN
ncbi:MAG: nuclease-related domain-containing protein [Nitrososphaerales archaeon]